MKTLAMPLVLLAVAGCGPNRGEKWADKTNEKVVAKIDAGQVNSEVDLAIAQLDAMTEAMKELDLDEITQGEKKTFDEKIARYEEDWKKKVSERSKRTAGS